MACSRLLAGGNITFVDGSLITYSADHIINTWAVTLKADMISSIIRFNLETAQFFGDVVAISSGTPVLVNGTWCPRAASGSIEPSRNH